MCSERSNCLNAFRMKPHRVPERHFFSLSSSEMKIASSFECVICLDGCVLNLGFLRFIGA